jgi:phage terminase large subunit-like protein
VEWENGAVGYCFSAEDPDSLRGPQFGAAWADEFCAWAHPEATLANLRLGLRLADAAQTVVTTTPRPTAALRRLLAEPTCVRTDAPTTANAANLGAGFLDDLMALYGGTRLAAQELEGKITEAEGSLWTLAELERARGEAPGRLERTVVAVDPPATAGGACGIVVAGRAGERVFVLADRTVRGVSPGGWAARVAAAVETWGADAVVAESNQGGDMVRSVLESAGVDVFVKLVSARWGKRARAEPVAALYEQRRVVHCGVFPALEEEMLALGGEGVLEASPDRADALVWAVTDLLIDRRWEGPRLTVL